jgi:hypothetical protein
MVKYINEQGTTKQITKEEFIKIIKRRQAIEKKIKQQRKLDEMYRAWGR